MIPVVQWNEDAESWQIAEIGGHLTGPVISDISNACRTIWTLVTNPVARQRWDEEADNLARKILSSLRQLEKAPETVGIAAEKLGAEGIADMAREQQDRFTNASRPVSTIRHGQAVLPPRQAPGGQQQGGFEGGFDGGFGGGGFDDGGGF